MSEYNLNFIPLDEIIILLKERAKTMGMTVHLTFSSVDQSVMSNAPFEGVQKKDEMKLSG